MEFPRYPLMFFYKNCIFGNGFLADVRVSGRALMFKSDDEWWMYGVCPSAIAESGKTPEETTSNFKESYEKVLFDVASGSQNFVDFKKQVKRFFHEQEPEIKEFWENAFMAIRNGEVTPEAPFSNLPQKSPESRPTEVMVKLIENPTQVEAKDNVISRYEIPAMQDIAA